MPVPFPCQRPLWPCWQHEKLPMAAKMEESSRFSFAFSQVCGTGSCCRCVHTYLCVCNCFFQRLLFLLLSLSSSLLPLTPLLQPLWFTWLCPVSTFWHKSQLTRPTVCTLRPRNFKWPKPIGIHTLPPPAALAFKVKVTSTTLCYPQLGKSSKRALYLFIFKMAKERNKQLRLGIWNWAIEFIRNVISICNEKRFRVLGEFSGKGFQGLLVTKSRKCFL